MRTGTLGLVRDGAYLLVIGVIGLALAGGVLAADRAINSTLPTVAVGASGSGLSDAVTVKAGQLTVLEMTNTSGAVQSWMAQDLANVELLARSGQTSRLRVSIPTPGTYTTMLGAPDGHDAVMGTLVVTP